MWKQAYLLVVLTMLAAGPVPAQSDPWSVAARNAAQANEAFTRCQRVVNAWYDTQTGRGNLLLPRKVGQREWLANDSGSDMWAHFVNVAWVLGDSAMEARVRGTLNDIVRLTTRVGRMSDWYNIDLNRFSRSNIDMYWVIFGAAEEVKDGMLPIVDLTGQKVYLERGRNLLSDIMAVASVKTRRGVIPNDGAEICGDMLQSLCRFYGATGDANMKRWAEMIGESWIYDVLPRNNGLPAHEWDFDRNRPRQDMLNLSDHGNEIIVGLVELLYLEYLHDTPRYKKYLPAVQKMIDRLLACALTSKGMWVYKIKPSTLEVLSTGHVDTWGYCAGAVYSLYMMTGQRKYRDAVEKMMRTVATDPSYRNWGRSNDAWADTIESGILLYNRIPLSEMASWLETITPVFLAQQKANGMVQDTYLDGNYVRTALMWGQMKTAGTRVLNWRSDLKYGATVSGDKLYVQLSAARPWQGLLCCDAPRARQNLGLTVDYPRLNQFPQWYAIQPDYLYAVTIDDGPKQTWLGQDLIDGLALNVGTTPVKVVVWRDGNPPYGD